MIIKSKEQSVGVITAGEDDAVMALSFRDRIREKVCGGERRAEREIDVEGKQLFPRCLCSLRKETV
jgi:hypothetical protein